MLPCTHLILTSCPQGKGWPSMGLHPGIAGAWQQAWYWKRRRSWELHPDLQAERLGLAWAFELSKPIHSDALPPTRPRLLILLILSKSSTSWSSWWLKCSTIWAYGGGYSYSNHHNLQIRDNIQCLSSESGLPDLVHFPVLPIYLKFTVTWKGACLLLGFLSHPVPHNCLGPKKITHRSP